MYPNYQNGAPAQRGGKPKKEPVPNQWELIGIVHAKSRTNEIKIFQFPDGKHVIHFTLENIVSNGTDQYGRPVTKTYWFPVNLKENKNVTFELMQSIQPGMKVHLKGKAINEPKDRKDPNNKDYVTAMDAFVIDILELPGQQYAPVGDYAQGRVVPGQAWPPQQAAQQGAYAPQGYGPQGGYAQQPYQGGYPPQGPGQYPQQPAYPPRQGGYAPQQPPQGYGPQGGYPQQGGAYQGAPAPQQQGAYAQQRPAPQGGQPVPPYYQPPQQAAPQPRQGQGSAPAAELEDLPEDIAGPGPAGMPVKDINL